MQMVPVEGIEPPTFGLQNRCSTAELNRQTSGSYGATRHEKQLGSALQLIP
jgi:hypothetical protein